MLYINKITNAANQQLTLTGIPGIQIATTLRFLPRAQQWILGVAYGDVSIQGVSIMNSPNMLRKWKNVIPFGISCLRTDGLDPYQDGDFADEIANLYLLDATDVAQVETDFYT